MKKANDTACFSLFIMLFRFFFNTRCLDENAETDDNVKMVRVEGPLIGMKAGGGLTPFNNVVSKNTRLEAHLFASV